MVALSEDLGRLLSGWLRMPNYSEEILKEIISQLVGIGGFFKSTGFGKNRVASIPDAIAKVLAEAFICLGTYENGHNGSDEKPMQLSHK